MAEKQHYIYIIHNDTTGEWYVGKRTCADHSTDKYMGSGTLLRKKMDAHPEHQWRKEVVMLLDTAKEAYEMEEAVLGDRWLTDHKCLNLTAGGRARSITEKELMERKMLQLKWESGEDFEAKRGAVIYLSNDTLMRYTRVALSTASHREQIKKLLEAGFTFGGCTAYDFIGLHELDASAETRGETAQEMLMRGEFPPTTKSLWLTNHETKQYTRLSNSKKAIKHAQKLFDKGWSVGNPNKAEYEFVGLKELLNLWEEIEEAYLNGEECPLKSYAMYHEEFGFYTTLHSTTNGKRFSPHTKLLYDNGWRFGSYAPVLEPLNQAVGRYQDYKKLYKA